VSNFIEQKMMLLVSNNDGVKNDNYNYYNGDGSA
jgi:hypothetical protein